MQRMQLALSVASYPMESGSKLPGYGGAAMNDTTILLLSYAATVTAGSAVAVAVVLYRTWRNRK